MALLDDLTLGRYQPGISLLHRCDPRLKLLAVPALVAAAFAAVNVFQLLLLSTLAAGAWLLGGLPWRTWWRAGRALRWLFLFTILLHLLWSPGRTLFGQSWLSADGLMTGILACWRIALALAGALLLAGTTPPGRLAGGLGTLLAPLERLRLPVRNGVEMTLLVLHFIPLLREEALVVHGEMVLSNGSIRPEGLLGRARSARGMVLPLLLRLVDRADDLARRLAEGEALPEFGTPEPTGTLPGRQLLVFVLVAGTTLGLLRWLS